MRFLSHIREFSVVLVEPRVRYTNYGDRIVDREAYVAWFQPDITQADLEFAERIFEKGGFLYGRQTLVDEVTLAPLINRLSVFDTDEMALREGWDAEFKEFAERKLQERALMGSEFRQVVDVPAVIPWPSYDEFPGTLEQFANKIVADGYDSRAVLAYERQHQDRPAVVNLLVGMIRGQEEVEMGAIEVPA